MSAHSKWSLRRPIKRELSELGEPLKKGVGPQQEKKMTDSKRRGRVDYMSTYILQNICVHT